MSLAFAPHAALPVRHRLRSPAICFTRAAVSPPSAPPPKQPLHLQPPVLEERATPGLADVLRDLADTSGTKRFASPSRGVVQAEWRRHRQGLRYVRHLLGFPLSKLARRLTPVIAFVGAESALAACVEAFSGVTPHLSGQPIALLSGVVGLLLAFRTNASLARYYEARGAWNIIVNRSVDISRVGLEYIDPAAPPTTFSSLPSKESRSSQLVRYVAAFPYVLRSHLESADDSTLEIRIGHLISGNELTHLMSSSNRPNAMLQLVTSVAGESCPMEHHARVKLDGGITALLDAFGSLEKILRTPIPLGYTRHTSRVCLLWCFAMPWVLYGDMGAVASTVASGLITFVLLGIEDIGVQIEDPSRVLPVKELCASIEEDVRELEVNRAAILNPDVPVLAAASSRVSAD